MKGQGAVLFGPVSLTNGEHREGTVLAQAMLKAASPYQVSTLQDLYFVSVKSQRVKHAGPESVTAPSS